MAFVTVLAIETDIHLSGIKPGNKCKELVPGWIFYSPSHQSGVCQDCR